MRKAILGVFFLTSCIAANAQNTFQHGPATASPNAPAQKKPADYVNVFTGTSNSRWMLFPGATMPFGMVKLSPDNQGNVWNGGYEYTIESISGFSFLHAFGLSALSIMPVSGGLNANEGWLKNFAGPADGPFNGMWTAGYRSRFKKDTEHGSPGYYSVELLDGHVKAELTSTMRCGIARFTYHEKGEAHLLLNFDFPTEERTQVLETHIEKISPTELRGYIKQKNGYASEFTVYFVMQSDQAIATVDAWQSQPYEGKELNYGTEWRQQTSLTHDITSFNGKGGSGAILNFGVAGEKPVVLRTGLSFVSMDQAGLNLAGEMSPYGFDFDKVARSNKAVWNDLLGKIEVSGGKENDKEKFYTNLYRTFTGKSVMNDLNGKYRDVCHRERQLADTTCVVYSSDALWGAQWDLFPLWTLVYPRLAESWANSLLQLSDDGGWIPYAPVALGYSPVMGAQHQNSLIISAWQKGIRGFDADKAFRAILHDYTTPGQDYPCGGFAGDRHLRSYQDLGYVSDEAGPASNTMEYAYDDWCLGQFAKALGKEDLYRKFQDRSMNYKNIFDTTVGFVRQRHADGTWVAPFDPYKFGTVGGWNGKGFMEGTPFQYSFFVPQDIAGMIRLTGKENFIRRLEQGFEQDRFDLGNEPCLETPFLFNYAGKPWLTQKYTRRIIAGMYDTSPYQGWVGEEDEGQMGAYFVLLSMGLFEVDGGCRVKPFYDISTPLFDKIVIHLDDRYYPGKTFTILTEQNKPGNVYIRTATLNGRPLTRARIDHDEIVKGGMLIYGLDSQPNKHWGLEASTP